MITVRVRSDLYDTNVIEYEKGRRWHIADDGFLHIIGDAGNIGAHARDTWASVSHSGDETGTLADSARDARAEFHAQVDRYFDLHTETSDISLKFTLKDPAKASSGVNEFVSQSIANTGDLNK